MCNLPKAVMDDDDAYNNNASGLSDFVIDNLVGCGIMGRIVEDVSTSRNPSIGMQTVQRCHSRSNDDISFINFDEKNPIVKVDSDEDIL